MQPPSLHRLGVADPVGGGGVGRCWPVQRVPRTYRCTTYPTKREAICRLIASVLATPHAPDP